MKLNIAPPSLHTMFLCSWPLVLFLLFLQVSAGLVPASQKQKSSSTKKVPIFFSDQHSKTTQLPTHTRASANAAAKQTHGKTEGGIAATLICISLNYHKPDFNKQCYNCLFCAEIPVLPTYKQWCNADFHNDQGFLGRSYNKSWCNKLQLCQNLECCVRRTPEQNRIVLWKDKSTLEVILDQSRSCQERFF